MIKPQFFGTTFEDVTRYLREMVRAALMVVESADITPASVASNQIGIQIFTVKHLTTNELVFVESPGNQTTDIGVIGARVSAADTLAIAFINLSGGAKTPVSGTYRIIRIEP